MPKAKTPCTGCKTPCYGTRCQQCGWAKPAIPLHERIALVKLPIHHRRQKRGRDTSHLFAGRKVETETPRESWWTRVSREDFTALARVMVQPTKDAPNYTHERQREGWQ